MGWFKDGVGVVVSATVTVGLYLGPAIAGLILGLRPIDTIDLLTAPERRASIEGAWVLAAEEREGDLDGTETTEPTEEQQPAPEDPEPPKPNASPVPADGPVDPDATADRVGTPVETPGEANAGTAAGGPAGSVIRRPDGSTRPSNGRQQAQSKKKCAPSYDGIRRRSDGTYEVTRELVNYHTSSVARFNELGWSSPNEKGDGHGWYVSGFGCNDPLWHGGLRRGDIVLTVNGKKTNNMMQILLLYSKVKAQKDFEVVILRKGKEIRLKYEIVKG